MTQKHDYRAALKHLDGMEAAFVICMSEIEKKAMADVEVFPEQMAAIRNALLLAEKVTGEPTEEMINGKAREVLLRYILTHDITKGQAIEAIFKAMIAAAQHEVSEDGRG